MNGENPNPDVPEFHDMPTTRSIPCPACAIPVFVTELADQVVTCPHCAAVVNLESCHPLEVQDPQEETSDQEPIGPSLPESSAQPVPEPEPPFESASGSPTAPPSPQTKPSPPIRSGGVGSWIMVGLLASLTGWSLYSATVATLAEYAAVPTPPAETPPLVESPFDRFDPASLPQDRGTFAPVELIGVLEHGRSDPPLCLAISPDGEWLAAGLGSTVQVWRTGTVQLAGGLGEHPGPVRAGF